MTHVSMSMHHISSYIPLSQATIFYEKFVMQDNQDVTPLIVLHGGPGATHDYLLSLQHVAQNCPVIFYDQGGTGESTMHDINFTDWTLEYYVQELADFIHALGYTKVYLLGHSWGGMLATAYVQKYSDSVEKLILVSPCLSSQHWMQDCEKLAKSISDELSQTIIGYEAAGRTDEPEYVEAVSKFYANFFCRIPVKLKDLQRTIYETMWGTYEMTCTGNLYNVDMSVILSTLQIPIVIVAGQYDMASPSRMQEYVSLVDQGLFYEINGAAHLASLEKPEELVNIVNDFLAR